MFSAQQNVLSAASRTSTTIRRYTRVALDLHPSLDRKPFNLIKIGTCNDVKIGRYYLLEICRLVALSE